MFVMFVNKRNIPNKTAAKYITLARRLLLFFGIEPDTHINQKKIATAFRRNITR